MRIVIATDLSEPEIFDIDPKTDFDTFEIIVGSYVNIDPINLLIKKDGRTINGNSMTSIESLGIQDGDVLMASLKHQQSTNNSPLLDFSGIDASIFSRGTSQQNRSQSNSQNQQSNSQFNNNHIDLTQHTGTEDLYDPNVQSKIEEFIRQQNIQSQFEQAMEYNPESFGKTTMLYIDCKVNQSNAKAFIDSGAQMTIISHEFAKLCHVDHLIDKRFAGTARGVGTQQIAGRVHCMQLQIGSVFLQTSVSVLESQEIHMIIGLDFLKRYQCNINLKRNVLEIGSMNVETPFLPENELPQYAKLNNR